VIGSLLLLVAAGFGAGAMNAIAGGGSFVSFPALVAAGLPGVAANASSTVALVPGTLASAFAYTTGAHRMGIIGIGGISFRLLLAASVAGGLTGAVLLLVTPPATFDAVIPWLLLMATIVFAGGRRIGEALRRRVRLGRGSLLGVQFVLGVYGGYFGGAVGLMMMAAWTLLDTADLKAMNPVRTLLTSAMNAAAVACFVIAGQVWWPQALAVLAGALAGGYAGARVGQRLPPGVVRLFVTLVTVCMTIAFFVRGYA
jgi:uncharacterized membrane protein YfcA